MNARMPRIDIKNMGVCGVNWVDEGGVESYR